LVGYPHALAYLSGDKKASKIRGPVEFAGADLGPPGNGRVVTLQRFASTGFHRVFGALLNVLVSAKPAEPILRAACRITSAMDARGSPQPGAVGRFT
jgi:hypothetical protein